jgi:hypothetical protein
MLTELDIHTKVHFINLTENVTSSPHEKGQATEELNLGTGHQPKPWCEE